MPEVRCIADSSELLDKCRVQGFNPYYIYRDIHGKGNESVAVQAYVEAYNEIKRFETDTTIVFDYIFYASGTGMTQSGLICGSLLHDDNNKIVGILIARTEEIGKIIIKRNIKKYMRKIRWFKYRDVEGKIYFNDNYVCRGYGKYNFEIMNIIGDLLNRDGIP